MLTVQGELALRQVQVEKLSAEGEHVLKTLQPLRSKSFTRIHELLVSTRLHYACQHPAVRALEMLSAVSSTPNACGYSLAAVHARFSMAGKPSQARGWLHPVY